LKLDKNSINEEGYHIRSLYFDNMYDTSLHEKVDGIFQRKKYRIRIYNKSDKVIKLERKSKFNEYVCKESAGLSRGQYDLIMQNDLDFLKESEHPLMREFYADCKHLALKPSVVVDYIREAYIYPLSDVRVTFDKALSSCVQSFQILDPELVTTQMVQERKTILEVKYNEFLPGHIYGLLQMSASLRSTISKYAICKENRKLYTY